MSNIPFFIIGVLRWAENREDPLIANAYVLMALCGICSGIHHATTPKWTILIDWIPIASLLLYSFSAWDLLAMSATTMFEIGLALSVLFTDHLVRLMPIPWGHVTWHLVAALVVDAFLQNMQKIQ